MFKRLKSKINLNQAQLAEIIRQNKVIIEQNQLITLYNKELLYSQIFYDAIKGNKSLENLSLNVGRWAGNYTLFYVVYRILKELQPNRILELGLGESSKFISAFIADSPTSSHLIVEHDENWKNKFLKTFALNEQSEIIVVPLKNENVKGHSVKVYSSLDEILNKSFDFYLIDGPHGSENYSRYDAYKIVNNFVPTQEFIFLIDDYDRKGEQQTTDLIISELKRKKIKHYNAVYSGIKSIMVIGSSKYDVIKNF